LIPYTVNYYDTYPGTNIFNTLPQPDVILGQAVLTNSQGVTVNNISSIRSLKTMPTASLVKNLDDDNWSSAHIWYDLQGRAVGSHGKNHLGGYTKTERQLDFSGAVLFANTYHKKTNADAEVAINERFIYDNQFRLKQHYHQVNNLAEELLADYTYNELGQLTSKKVGNNLQNIEYTYNTRGWVTKVNDPSNLGSKLFGYELKFASTSDASVAQANYNGNITEMIWKNAADGILKKYSYQYDAYNRLKNAIYQEPGTTVPMNNFFNENITYDSNGNIVTLNRNQKSYTSLAEQIDELTYTYNGNKLTSVIDHKSNYWGYPDTSGSTITYDDNGNMNKHEDKGMLDIKYNILNLPSYIRFNNYVTRNGEDVYRNMKFSYRADGVKIKKTHNYFSGRNQWDAVATTEYLDGFQYTSDTGDILLQSGLKFFPTSEGYYDFKNNKYIYSYVDHLGNIRVSYTREGANAVIVEKNDYYAFGLKHGDPTDTSGLNYNYEYNGKEYQGEIGMYDYGARFYMPDIGRWGVIDPLAETSRRFTPYHYGNNNPLRFIDPDGRITYDWNEHEAGREGVYRDDNGHEMDWNDVVSSLYNNSETGSPVVSSLAPSGGSPGGSVEGSSLSPWMQANIGSEYNQQFDIINDISTDCCPDGVVAGILEEGLTISRGGAIGIGWYVVNTVFGSAHIPDHTNWAYRYTSTKPLSLNDVRVEYKVREKDSRTGSYTILFDDGHKYHGKGPIERMFTSAILQMTRYNVLVKSFDWTPSPSDREAYKAEYRRMQTDRIRGIYEQGYQNPINYNMIQSPGYKYILQDGY
jgi:RHS repeat-associated protein